MAHILRMVGAQFFLSSEPTRMAPPDLDVQKDEDEEVTSIPVMQEECPHHF